MRFERRGGVPLRPLPFVAGWVLVVLGVLRGFAWIWTTTRFTGNLLVQVRVPHGLLSLGPTHWVWLVVGCAGLALAVFAHTPSGPGRTGFVSSSRRFYPFVAALGLFLLAFGSVYLFDASVQGTTAPGGYATFLYLDYANLLERPTQSVFGLLVAALGAAALAGSVGRASPSGLFEEVEGPHGSADAKLPAPTA